MQTSEPTNTHNRPETTGEHLSYVLCTCILTQPIIELTIIGNISNYSKYQIAPVSCSCLNTHS